jgi:hypothetical protein
MNKSHIVMFVMIVAIFAILSGMFVPSNSRPLVLPAEITPDIRRVCEKDVRKLCVHKHSTVDSVVRCVSQKFNRLNKKCQNKLVRAGLI